MVKIEPDEAPSSSDIWTVYRGRSDAALHFHTDSKTVTTTSTMGFGFEAEPSPGIGNRAATAASTLRTSTSTSNNTRDEEQLISISGNAATVSTKISLLHKRMHREIQSDSEGAASDLKEEETYIEPVKDCMAKSVSVPTWIEMYRRLVAYKKEHKMTSISCNCKEDPPLANWVQRQRKSFSDDMLIETRVYLLESIGFIWRLKARTSWMNMYRSLVAYKKKNKTTKVPGRYKEDPRLAKWVLKQRGFCKEQSRIDLLNDIGFDWKPSEREINWMKRYRSLVAYKKKHNSTRVRSGWKEDPKLGPWVYHQRYHCKLKSRRDLLDEIGFDWNI